MESYSSTLKHELELDNDAVTLNSPKQLIRHLAFWIEGYDNRERSQATIGYSSPIDYKEQYVNTRTITAVISETCPLEDHHRGDKVWHGKKGDEKGPAVMGSAG